MEKIKSSFNRAALTYDAAAVLHREVGNRMLERLDLIKLQPATILDLGCNTGFFSRLLASRYPAAQIIALDIAETMLRLSRQQATENSHQCFIGADAAALPFADHSLDLIFSDLVLQWCGDLSPIFQELKRVLKPEGVLLFSIYGPNTLQELRHSFAAVDDFSHVNAFPDMHDLGDWLLEAKFADPVVDMEMLTLLYASVDDLMHEIKALGANQVQGRIRNTLTGKNRMQAMRDAYEQFRYPNGKVPATYEIVYGLTFGPPLNVDHTLDEEGIARIPLSHIAGLRRSRS